MTEDQLKHTLRARGQRVTPQRLLIHRAVRELGRHATAEEILDKVSPRLPNASLPTVYATLELFEELGTIRRVPAGGATLYDPRVEEHHHLVCTRCGRVEDLDFTLDERPALRAARGAGFAPEHAELVVRGLCARCARRAAAA